MNGKIYTFDRNDTIIRAAIKNDGNRMRIFVLKKNKGFHSRRRLTKESSEYCSVVLLFRHFFATYRKHLLLMYHAKLSFPVRLLVRLAFANVSINKTVIRKTNNVKFNRIADQRSI